MTYFPSTESRDNAKPEAMSKPLDGDLCQKSIEIAASERPVEGKGLYRPQPFHPGMTDC